MGAQGGELLLLESTLEGEHHREPARAGEAAEMVRTGEAWGGGYAVGLDEFAPGSTILKCAKNGEDHERCVIYDGAGTGDSFALKCLWERGKKHILKQCFGNGAGGNIGSFGHAKYYSKNINIQCLTIANRVIPRGREGRSRCISCGDEDQFGEGVTCGDGGDDFGTAKPAQAPSGGPAGLSRFRENFFVDFPV